MENRGLLSRKNNKSRFEMSSIKSPFLSRVIFDKPNLTDAYMKRCIKSRISKGQLIEEMWLIDGTILKKLFKKSEE